MKYPFIKLNIYLRKLTIVKINFLVKGATLNHTQQKKKKCMCAS